MYLGNIGRDNTQCSTGTQYYTCSSSGWKGCCSVNACDVPWCPDAGSPPNPNVASSSLTSSSSTPSDTASTAPTGTVTASWSSSSSSSSISGVLTATTTQTTYVAANLATATPSPTPSPQPSSKNPATPIIAGTVSGVVAVSILSVLIWFCYKRRQQKKHARKSIIKYGMPTREYVLSRALTPDVNIPKDGEVFAEFGGRHKTPSPLPRRPVPARIPVPPRAPIPIPIPQQAIIEEADPIESPLEAPIPDVEKSGLAPPPMVDHPAFNIGTSSSLDQFPSPPAYNSPQPISSPPLTSHPAYHVSQLSQHPAFSSPRSSPRAATFPHRTPQVKRQKSSPRAGSCAGPMDITPVISSIPESPHHELDASSYYGSPTTTAPPPLPRSELEADVPSNYPSPSTTRPPSQISKTAPSDIRIQTQPQTQAPYNPADYASFSTTGRVRNNTLGSTYSIPIGLGVSSPSSHYPHQAQTQNPDSAISPQSPFHLETRYPHLNHPLPPLPNAAKLMLEMRDGREKEVFSGSSSSISSKNEKENEKEKESENGKETGTEMEEMGKEKERWSGATVLNTESEMSGNRTVGQMHGVEVRFVQVNAETPTPTGETPTGMTPSDDFKTWETWAQR